MAARRNATSTQAGILRPEEFARHADVQRLPCSPALDLYVENHWHLRWDLPPGRHYTSSTLPHPACTLSVELGHPRAGVAEERVLLTGVVTRRFDVELRDAGWVFAVKFRPGGLAALTGVEARTLTDLVVPAAGHLGDALVATLRGFAPDLPAADAQRQVEERLVALVPPEPDPGYALVLDLVERMLTDRDLTRVAELQPHHGLSARQVERLFSRFVGVGPKWLLGRYRMHDVVTALDAGYDGTLADLAAEHGWYDQAHFTRDFTALVGTPPRDYRRATP